MPYQLPNRKQKHRTTFNTIGSPFHLLDPGFLHERATGYMSSNSSTVGISMSAAGKATRLHMEKVEIRDAGTPATLGPCSTDPNVLRADEFMNLVVTFFQKCTKM